MAELIFYISLFLESRYVNIGLFNLRQLFFAKFDLKVHTDQGNFLKKKNRKCCRIILKLTSVSEDYTQLWNTMREKISLVKYDKICPGQGSFEHIVGGYDVGYYG